jgi:hypothetical protein
MAGGVHNFYKYGVTFDLETGELVPLDRFIKTDIKIFNDQIITLMYKFLDENGTYGLYDKSEFENKHHSYSFDNYNYFFSGYENYHSYPIINLIFDEYNQLGNSYIIRYVDTSID